MVVLQDTWQLLILALQPVVEVVLLCGLGAWLAQPSVNIFPADARDHLNKLVFFVFSPAFVFSTLGEAVDATKVLQWWYLPFNVLLVSTIGYIMGKVVVWVCKPPSRFHRLTIACCVVGNIGNLSLVLVYGVCRDSANPFGDEGECLKDGVAKVSFGMWMAVIVMWTFIYNYLKPEDTSGLPEYLESGTRDDLTDKLGTERSEHHVVENKVVELGKNLVPKLTSGANERAGGDDLMVKSFDKGLQKGTPHVNFLTASQTGSNVKDTSGIGKNHTDVIRNMELHETVKTGSTTTFADNRTGHNSIDVSGPDMVANGGVSESDGKKSMSFAELGKLENLKFEVDGRDPSVSSWKKDGEIRYKKLQFEANRTMLAVFFGTVMVHVIYIFIDLKSSKLPGVLQRVRSPKAIEAESPSTNFRQIFCLENFEKLKQMLTANIRLRDIFTPPTTSVFLALIIGVIPPVKGLFFGAEAPLKMITQTVDILGMALIPSMMLILGGNLAKGPGQTDLGVRTIVGITATRLLLLPIIGLGVVPLVKFLRFTPPGDSMMRFILLLQFSCPTAINLGSVVQLHGVGEREASVVLFWGYIFCAFPVLAFMVIFFALLF